jgi:hypothetical protein
VTARWRPSSGGARVASAGDAREGEEQSWGEVGGDAWACVAAGGGAAATVKRRPEGSAAGGRAEQSRTHVREEEEERGEARGTGL